MTLNIKQIDLKSICKLISEFDDFERLPSEQEVGQDLIYKADYYLKSQIVSDLHNAAREIERLQARKTSLIYRLELDHLLEFRGSPEDLHHEMNKFLVDWIYQSKGFNCDTFDHDPEKKIIEVCERFPVYARLLLKDRILRNRFFQWAIRDNNPIAPIVYFPSLAEQLIRCNLAQRIGYNKGADLLIRKSYSSEGHAIRTLHIPVEGSQVNIGNQEKKVTLKDGTELTLGQLLEIFRKKRHGSNDIEFFPGVGITYWPSYEPWKVLDLDNTEYWKDGPQLKILNLREARKLYGKTVPGMKMIETVVPFEKIVERDGAYWFDDDLFLLNEVEIIDEIGGFARIRMRERIPVDGNNFIYVIRATKEKDMSAMKTHGFGDILIPLKSGRYSLFTLGKYPREYPDGVMSLIANFANVVTGSLQVVDDNIFYNHRNHTRECIGLKTEQGKIFLEIIRILLMLARDNKMGFEFQTEGCCKMVQVDILKMLMLLEEEGYTDAETVREKVKEWLYSEKISGYDFDKLPNFFRTTVDRVKGDGALGWFVTVIKKFPCFLQPYLFTATFLFMGAWRKMTFKVGKRDVILSYLRSSCFWDGSAFRLSCYNPGYLHYQQEKKGITLLKRKLRYIKLPFYKESI
jgi:hypothetical protein